jgi:hypothetical protein
MHVALNAHLFFLVLALVLALLAAFNVPSTRIGLFPLSFACYLVAVFFT